MPLLLAVPNAKITANMNESNYTINIIMILFYNNIIS